MLAFVFHLSFLLDRHIILFVLFSKKKEKEKENMYNDN